MGTLRRSSVFMSANAVLRLGVGLVTAPLLVRLLGVEEYGLWAVLAAVLATVSLMDLEITSAVKYYLSADNARKTGRGASLGQYFVLDRNGAGGSRKCRDALWRSSAEPPVVPGIRTPQRSDPGHGGPGCGTAFPLLAQVAHRDGGCPAALRCSSSGRDTRAVSRCRWARCWRHGFSGPRIRWRFLQTGNHCRYLHRACRRTEIHLALRQAFRPRFMRSMPGNSSGMARPTGLRRSAAPSSTMPTG